jgi:hypothetical protein
MNNVVHTGPNTLFGGLNEGLFIVWYQEETELEVAIEPIKPASNGIAIQTISIILFLKLYELCFALFFAMSIFNEEHI